MNPGTGGALTRRSILKGAVMGLAITAGGGLTACTSSQGSGEATGPRSNRSAVPSSSATAEPGTATTGASRSAGGVLLAYFSRAGEKYYYGGRRNLQVGNTEVLAQMISGLIDCDVH